MDIGASLMKSLGIDPAQFEQVIRGVINTVGNIDKEVKAAKQGFSNAATHYSERLDKIETSQQEILALLRRNAGEDLEPLHVTFKNGNDHV